MTRWLAAASVASLVAALTWAPLAVSAASPTTTVPGPLSSADASPAPGALEPAGSDPLPSASVAPAPAATSPATASPRVGGVDAQPVATHWVTVASATSTPVTTARSPVPSGRGDRAPSASLRGQASTVAQPVGRPPGPAEPIPATGSFVLLAAVALLLVASVLLVAGRRVERRSPAGTRAGAGVARGPDAGVPRRRRIDLQPDVADGARRERRTGHSASDTRLQPGDDPILRAMGLDPDAPAAGGAAALRARNRRASDRRIAQPRVGQPPPEE